MMLSMIGKIPPVPVWRRRWSGGVNLSFFGLLSKHSTIQAALSALNVEVSISSNRVSNQR